MLSPANSGFVSSKLRIRSTITRVLPVPAPATTSSGPSPCSTAARWPGFSPMFGLALGSEVRSEDSFDDRLEVMNAVSFRTILTDFCRGEYEAKILRALGALGSAQGTIPRERRSTASARRNQPASRFSGCCGYCAGGSEVSASTNAVKGVPSLISASVPCLNTVSDFSAA